MIMICAREEAGGRREARHASTGGTRSTSTGSMIPVIEVETLEGETLVVPPLDGIRAHTHTEHMIA